MTGNKVQDYSEKATYGEKIHLTWKDRSVVGRTGEWVLG